MNAEKALKKKKKKRILSPNKVIDTPTHTHTHTDRDIHRHTEIVTVILNCMTS